MARPNWEWIRVDVLLPEHPKIDQLSRSARWTLIEMWCYAGRNHTDGIISAARWKTFGTAAERRQIADAGFADPIELGGYVMHDFVGEDGHQRSRDEIDELAERRKEIARKAANARWGKEAPPLEHMLGACTTHASSMLHAYAWAMPRQRHRQFKSRWYRWL